MFDYFSLQKEYQEFKWDHVFCCIKIIKLIKNSHAKKGTTFLPNQKKFFGYCTWSCICLANLKHDKSMKNCDDIALNFEKGQDKGHSQQIPKPRVIVNFVIALINLR